MTCPYDTYILNIIYVFPELYHVYSYFYFPHDHCHQQISKKGRLEERWVFDIQISYFWWRGVWGLGQQENTSGKGRTEVTGLLGLPETPYTFDT